MMREAEVIVASLCEAARFDRQNLAVRASGRQLRPIGLSVPRLREVLRRVHRELKSLPPRSVVSIVRALAALPYIEIRQAAYEILAARRDAFATIDAAFIRRLARGADNWGTVDGLGVTVVGRAWREGLIADSDVMGWARSTDRWMRRLALVATVGLNSKSRGGAGDPRRTLVVAARLLDDRDDMVVKALSWALRELVKRDPTAVRAFVAKHAERLAPRVRREVANKLDTGLKNPARRGGRPGSGVHRTLSTAASER